MTFDLNVLTRSTPLTRNTDNLFTFRSQGLQNKMHARGIAYMGRSNRLAHKCKARRIYRSAEVFVKMPNCESVNLTMRYALLVR
jgi:hypothetical protein